MREALSRLIGRPIAHRGLHALGRPGGPVENSIGAAEAAIAAGYGIECDIQRARDGEAMVFHDERLERLTTAFGRLANHDSAELSRMVLGQTIERMPTLAAFLAAVAGRVPIVIEIKRTPNDDLRLAERALELVSSYAGPIALESFDAAVVAHCLARIAPCPVGLVGPSEDGGEDPNLIRRCDFISWSIDHVADAAARYPVVPLTTWTIRNAADAAKAASHGAQIVFEGIHPVIEC